MSSLMSSLGDESVVTYAIPVTPSDSEPPLAAPCLALRSMTCHVRQYRPSVPILAVVSTGNERVARQMGGLLRGVEPLVLAPPPPPSPRSANTRDVEVSTCRGGDEVVTRW